MVVRSWWFFKVAVLRGKSRFLFFDTFAHGIYTSVQVVRTHLSHENSRCPSPSFLCVVFSFWHLQWPTNRQLSVPVTNNLANQSPPHTKYVTLTTHHLSENWRAAEPRLQAVFIRLFFPFPFNSGSEQTLSEMKNFSSFQSAPALLLTFPFQLGLFYSPCSFNPLD